MGTTKSGIWILLAPDGQTAARKTRPKELFSASPHATSCPLERTKSARGVRRAVQAMFPIVSSTGRNFLLPRRAHNLTSCRTEKNKVSLYKELCLFFSSPHRAFLASCNPAKTQCPWAVIRAYPKRGRGSLPERPGGCYAQRAPTPFGIGSN